MNRRQKVTFVAGGAAIAALVLGLGAAGAIAASRILSPSGQSKAVIDDAAAQLGVQPQALSDALKQALKNRVDEAVDAGKLDKEQAAKLKERIDSDEYPLLFGHGGHRGPGSARDGHPAVLDAAASYLGLTDGELRAALRDEKTLSEIAKDRGKTAAGLVEHLVATEAERIDEAAADGRLTDEHAAELKAALAERMEALVNGKLRGRRDGRNPRLWPGSGSPRGPPSLGGPPA